MARRCPMTGKAVQSGHHVSHANNKTKRRFLPNMQVTSLMSDVLGTTIRMRVTTHGLRTIEHNGGIDAFLLGTSDAKLPVEAVRLKRRIEKAQEKRTAAAAA
ncbi:50S ribosomal protein L28 [Allostella sp. ATCC 35155]|nr:50S ribosomal protein L28 [Stella sp. ATCC 35155]